MIKTYRKDLAQSLEPHAFVYLLRNYFSGRTNAKAIHELNTL